MPRTVLTSRSRGKPLGPGSATGTHRICSTIRWSLAVVMLAAFVGGCGECRQPVAQPGPTKSFAATPPAPAETEATADGSAAAAPAASTASAPEAAPATSADKSIHSESHPRDPELPANSTDPANPDTPATVASVAANAGADAGADAAPSGSDSAAAAASDSAAPERFLLLTQGGPIVIDVEIRLQGSDSAAMMEKLVAEAFQVADEDGDGEAKWEQVIDNPQFRSGRFGNLVPENDDERRQLLQMYDSNRNGLVDRDELPRFLTRNVGGGKSFSLRSSNEYRSTNRTRSPTRLLLDVDRDGSITAEEMRQASQILLERDADDDEVVFLAELKNSIDTMAAPTAMMSNRRRTNEPDTAVWLTNPSVDLQRRWGMVRFLLQELYSYGEPVQRDDWPLTPALFQLLDGDQNDELARNELPGLQTAPPHLVLVISFGGHSEVGSAPRIQLKELASSLRELQPDVRELPTRLSLRLPDVELDFFVNEDPSLSNVERAVKAQFMALDANGDGYLDEDETPPQLPGIDASFEALDADRDGKLLEAEVAAYLEQRNAVVRSQVRARAADQEDALFSALDSDGDGRLNSREMRESSVVLQSLDRNQDGKLQSHEIPGSMVVGFVRGNAQQDPQLFSGPAPSPPEDSNQTPRWFRGMDANADGEVSRREFFGSRDQFERLDDNGDGFLQRDEAEAR